VRRIVLSAFGIGFLPGLPGTWASAATAAAVLLAARATSTPLVPPLVALALGAVATLALARGQPDASWIVTDEVAGQGLALVGAVAVSGGALLPAVAAFVLFRVLDVWKPGPIGRAERLPGAVGILADDLLAGAVAGGLVAVAAAVGAFPSP
jgi:phosphatidylglycerophosphatase A